MKKKKLPIRYFYPAIFTYTEDKVEVSFPDIEVTLSAKEESLAYLSARAVLGRALYALEEADEDIPTARGLREVELEEGQCATLIDVYMPSVREGENNRSVNKMVTLPAWMYTAVKERDMNCSHMLQKMIREEIFDDYTE